MKQRLSLALSAAAFVLALLGVTPLGQAAGGAASDAVAVVAGQAKGSLQAVGVIKRGPRGPRGRRGPRGPAGRAGAAGAKGDTGAQGLQGNSGLIGKLGDLTGVPCQMTDGKAGVIGAPRPAEFKALNGSQLDSTVTPPVNGVAFASVICVGVDGFEPNDTQVAASSLNPYQSASYDFVAGENLPATLHPNGDQDWYSLPSRKVLTYSQVDAGQIKLFVTSGSNDLGMDVYEGGIRVATNVQKYDVPDANVHDWLVRVYGSGPASYQIQFGGTNL